MYLPLDAVKIIGLAILSENLKSENKFLELKIEFVVMFPFDYKFCKKDLTKSKKSLRNRFGLFFFLNIIIVFQTLKPPVAGSRHLRTFSVRETDDFAE